MQLLPYIANDALMVLVSTSFILLSLLGYLFFLKRTRNKALPPEKAELDLRAVISKSAKSENKKPRQ